MQVGDVVVPNRAAVQRGKVFHCGTGRYTHAIVASVMPFVLVSDDGTMMWSCTWEPSDVVALCQASEDIIRIVKNRTLSTRNERSGADASH